YSPVGGAPAEALGLAAVPDEVKQDRWDRFMPHPQAISTARLQLKSGKTIQGRIDAVDEEGPIARPMPDAPQIDGNGHIDRTEPLPPGDIVSVRVTAADESDLWAELVCTETHRGRWPRFSYRMNSWMLHLSRK